MRLTSSWPRRLAAVFGSALILMFFSEFYFLNEGPILHTLAETPLDGIPALVEFTVYYALFAYLLLLALAHFNVRGWGSFFLAAVLFGWATESVIVPVVYEAVPVSLIFPSVGWHALIDVLLGWYAVRVVMRLNRPWASALLFVVLGAAWGAWATWLWGSDTVGARLTPAEFMNFAVITGLAWITGMILLDRWGTGVFEPGKWEVRIVLAVTVTLFIMMAIPFLPVSLALPPLIGLTLLALRRGSAQPGRDVLLPLQNQHPAWWNYLLALLTPAMAALVYPRFYAADAGIPTEDITFLLLSVGAVLLISALVRPFIRRTSTTPS